MLRHPLLPIPRPVLLPIGCSWTQQLDGILTSSSDGTLTMWHMRPLSQAHQGQQAQQQGPAPLLPAAELRAAWSARATTPQRLACAGMSVYAPSATAAGQAAVPGVAVGSPWKGSPVQGQPGGPPSSTSSSPARDGDRYASVWWPQAREQQQRHYAGGTPAVGQEKLRHPTTVTGALRLLHRARVKAQRTSL